MNQKVKYLLRSVIHASQPRVCPSCGHNAGNVIDRKYFVTRLIKCGHCNLNFRHPTDSKKFLDAFYQADYSANYSEETLSITDLPTDDQLPELMENNFAHKRNHSPFVEALLQNGAAKVLDYGCSWGYSVYQLKQAGYDAEGFEISKIRAGFGEKIGVKIHFNENTVSAGLDLIMSNHAIEHLPVISDFIRFCSSKLKEDGIFVAFCPNGSDEYRKREPGIFHVNWGFLHPNYLDIDFAKTVFRRNPYMILTGDWNFHTNILSSWDGNSQIIGETRDGKELLIIAKPNKLIQ